VIDNLSFNVAQLMKDPVGSHRHVDVTANLRHLSSELGMAEDEDASVVAGRVRLMRTNQGILVQGTLTGETLVQCARCLAPVVVPLEIELEELFVPTLDIVTGKSILPEEEDQALWIDEHHILDLGEVVRQDVLLALPLHVVCSEECRGLCPDCGANLNETTCDCKPDIDPRWSSLADLLKN